MDGVHPMNTYVPLHVIGVDHLIGSTAITVSFQIPPEHAQKFTWQPGQHLPIRVVVDGQQHLRTYTISASGHTGEPLRITVKRVPGGKVSNWINDHVRVGDQIEAAAPRGQFICDVAAAQRRTLYFIGAGSGITPLYAMATAALAAEPDSQVFLLYGNHNAKTVIFADELKALSDSHGDRFAVKHVWSDTWASWQSPFAKGRVNTEVLEKFFDELPPYAQDAQYYVCGPSTMNIDVTASLQRLDVPLSRIHTESFGGATPGDRATDNAVAADAAIVVDADRYQIHVPEGQTVLEAALSAHVPAPFSCQAGVCGTCVAALDSGTVHQRAAMALSEDDLASDKILTCQAVPTSRQISVSYKTR